MKFFRWILILLIVTFYIYLFQNRVKFNLIERIHPSQHVIPFKALYQQPDKITCGPICCQMFLKHYNKNICIEEVKKYTRTVWFRYNNQDIGTTIPEYLVDALNHFGVTSELKYGNMDILKNKLSQNKPCIVLLRSAETTWHYVIVCGYTTNSILFADPCDAGIHELENKKFMTCWSWETDMDGEIKNQTFSTLLQCAEVYPYGIICVK